LIMVGGVALEWLCRWVALRLPTLRVVMIGFDYGGWCGVGMAMPVGGAALTHPTGYDNLFMLLMNLDGM